jgi:Fe-S-cluster containining protein
VDPVSLPVFDCEGCGFCCHLQSRPPFLPHELDRLPPALARSLSDDTRGPARDDSRAGPCSWLTLEGRCRHYDHRPAVCREFELASEDCLEIRRARGLAAPDTPAA